MLLKHVYMGCEFQRTLKLDISFSLEHFFISVAVFTHVASASLSYLSWLFDITAKNLGPSMLPKSVASASVSIWFRINDCVHMGY